MVWVSWRLKSLSNNMYSSQQPWEGTRLSPPFYREGNRHERAPASANSQQVGGAGLRTEICRTREPMHLSCSWSSGMLMACWQLEHIVANAHPQPRCRIQPTVTVTLPRALPAPLLTATLPASRGCSRFPGLFRYDNNDSTNMNNHNISHVEGPYSLQKASPAFPNLTDYVA